MTRCIPALLPLLVLAGCKEPGPATVRTSTTATVTAAPPAAAPTSAAAPADCARFAAAGVEFCAPLAWTSQKPASAMRIAQYLIPGKAGPVEMTLYCFGPGQGGARDANIQRWIGQFTNPAEPGAAVPSETNSIAHDSLDITIVRAAGTYAPSAMGPGAPAPSPQPAAALYGIIVEKGPKGTVFAKAVGPEATIRDQLAALEAFARSARVAG